MSGGEIAALVTAFGGILTGAFAAYKAVGSTRTDNVNVVVEAYKSITDNLQEENERLVARNERLEKALEECKEAANASRPN